MQKLKSIISLPILAVVVANIIWGTASPIFKWSLENIPLYTLAYLRFSIATLLILPFALKKLKIEKEDWPTMIFVAISGITLNILFFFWGLKKTTAIEASLIIVTAPLLTVIFSAIFLKEKLNRNIFLGIGVALAGFLITMTESILNHQSNGSLLGNFFIFIATLAFVVEVILTKKISRKYSALTITFWSFLIGTITFLPFFISDAIKPDWLSNLNINGIVGIIFGAVFSSTIAYYLYNWGIEKAHINKIAVLDYINPIASIAIAVPLLGEKISPFIIIGSIFIFIGIYISERRSRTLQDRNENDIITP